MKIGAPKEVFEGEKRVAMTPQSAAALQKLGYECIVETGAGEAARFSDAAYAEAGVRVVPSAADLWNEADVVAKVRPPTDAEVAHCHARPDRHQLRLSRPERRAARGAEGEGRHHPRDGHGAAHQPRAEDGRAVVDGEHRRLPRGDRGRQQLRPLLHRPGDRRRQGARRPRCSSSAPASPASRRSAPRSRSAPSSMPSTSAPRSPSRSSRWAPSSSSSISRSPAGRRRHRRLRRAVEPRVPRDAAREVPRARPGDRHRHHHGADPRPPGAEALDRRHGRADEARLGDRRPRRRARRQLRPDRPRPGDRDRRTASGSSATPTSRPGWRRRPRRSTRTTSAT